MQVLIDLFIAFIKVGLLSIGGGYAAIPLIQNEALITHSWLNIEEFNHLVTIAEMTPGSIAINAATFVGIKASGFLGAIVATLAVILPSLFLLSLLSYLYYRYRKLPLIQNTLMALRPVIIALILGVCISLFKDSVIFENHIKTIVCIVLFVASLLAIRKYQKSPLLIMGLCGISYLVINLLFSV